MRRPVTAVTLAALALAACGSEDPSSAEVEQRLMDEGRSELPETPRDAYSCAPKEAPGDFSCAVKVNDVLTYRFATVRVDGDRLVVSDPDVDLASDR